MMKAQFVIIARGGRFISPYISEVVLSTEDPEFKDWMDDEPVSNFDEWCNWELNELVYDLEEGGASAVVLSLEEYRNLPRL
jgi:hypothetical protein